MESRIIMENTESYVIVSDRNLENLIIRVNKHIATGYKPIGGLTVETHLTYAPYYYQALYLDLNTQPKPSIENDTKIEKKKGKKAL